MRHRALVLLLALGLVATACGQADDDGPVGAGEQAAGAPEAEQDDGGATDGEDADGGAAPDGDGQPAEAAEAAPEGTTPEQAAEIGADELGEVPVIMYHRILEDGGGRFDLTPQELRAELTELFDRGYRPVRVDELVAGEIDVPAGTTPVALTFDDSTREQLFYTDDGEIHPDSAVGILLDVADEHDDVEATGTFYVTESLFGVGAEAGAERLAHLHELGFEIGNHTATHARLDQQDAAGVQRELAGGVSAITDAVPEAQVRTMSLPLGQWPADRSLAAAGEHDGVAYDHEAVMLVGAHPSASPHHVDFSPVEEGVPRIATLPSVSYDPDDAAHRFTSAYWLEVFEESPDRRYVSDGDPATISFPAERSDELAEGLGERANPYEEDAGD